MDDAADREANESNGQSVGQSILQAVLKLPFIKVNRSAYVRETFGKYYSSDVVDRFIEDPQNSDSDIPLSMKDKLADDAIEYHAILAAAASTALSLPPKINMALIPADFTQILGNAAVLSQKLAYIYGWPDFDEEGCTDEYSRLIFLFLAAMFGTDSANGVLTKVLKLMSSANGGRNPARKSLLYIAIKATWPAVNYVCQKLAIDITRAVFRRSVAKILPFIGAPICGGMTYFSFREMGGKLKSCLRDAYVSKNNI